MRSRLCAKMSEVCKWKAPPSVESYAVVIRQLSHVGDANIDNQHMSSCELKHQSTAARCQPTIEQIWSQVRSYDNNPSCSVCADWPWHPRHDIICLADGLQHMPALVVCYRDEPLHAEDLALKVITAIGPFPQQAFNPMLKPATRHSLTHST